jgi:hypothetical protein
MRQDELGNGKLCFCVSLRVETFHLILYQVMKKEPLSRCGGPASMQMLTHTSKVTCIVLEILVIQPDLWQEGHCISQCKVSVPAAQQETLDRGSRVIHSEDDGCDLHRMMKSRSLISINLTGIW